MKINSFKAWLRRTGNESFVKANFLILLTTLSVGQLKSQQSYTFTTAGATGRFGPTQNQINVAYASTNLNSSVTINTQGIQEFTIPATGAYEIEAYGAQGYGAGGVGGRGAKMVGQFQFTAGQVLKILVGQFGDLSTNTSYNAQYQGGGGSFVTDGSNTPYIVAGGGGANWTSGFSTICDAPVSTSGNAGGGVGATAGAGGSGGNGGVDDNSACAGAGISGNGGGTAGGLSFINGGAGGFTTYGEGGFGGGGATASYNNRRCGGGGGYSGGGAAHGGTTGFPEGGGGGSYNAGTNQNNVPGVQTGDGLVIITKLCNVSLSSSSNPMCKGGSVVLTTNAVGPISWSEGASTNNSITVSPTVTTSYTVTGTGAGTVACVGSAIIVVSVTPLPNISAMVNPPLLCVGNAATLTGVGADTYTWNAGPSGSTTLVSPSVTTVYNFSGTNSFGCVNSATVNVPVNSNVLSVSANTTICYGESTSVVASGAVTYTWNNGAGLSGFIVSPTVNTVYSVLGTDAHNCVLSNSVSVNVNPAPNVFASSDKDIICKGEAIELSATGANTYAWSNPITGPQSGATVSLNLNIDVPYLFTVVGTDANGCTKTSTISIDVQKCTGINEVTGKIMSVNVYPNPGKGLFTIESGNYNSGTVQIMDFTGKVVLNADLKNGRTLINIETLSNGIYYARITSNNSSDIIKLIKN